MKTLERVMKWVAPGEGTRYNVLGERVDCKANAEDTSGDFSFFEITNFPGDGPPLHVHHREDEAFYILEGQYDVQVGAETYTVYPGDFAFLPKGIPHCYRNSGAGKGRFLVTVTPGGFERFFGELDALGDGPPNIEKVVAIADSYGIEMLPPNAPLPTTPVDALSPVLLRAGEGEKLRSVPGDHIYLKATGAETGGVATYFDGEVSPQAGPPLHVHRHDDEVFYITEGSFTFQVGDTVILAGPGTFLYAPRDIPHTFKNSGSTVGKKYNVSVPSGIEGMFRDLSVVDFSEPEAFAEAVKIVARYGNELVAPK